MKGMPLPIVHRNTTMYNVQCVQILWLRRRDLMILSHDTTVFTTDPRVEVNFAILYRNSIKYFQLFFWLRNPIVVLSRFTFTQSLGSGNYASQGWGSRMVVNMAVRWEHSVIGGSFEKIHQRSLSEYGKYCKISSFSGKHDAATRGSNPAGGGGDPGRDSWARRAIPQVHSILFTS